MAIRRQKFCRLIAILSPRIEYTISIGHIRRQKEKVSGAGNPLQVIHHIPGHVTIPDAIRPRTRNVSSRVTSRRNYVINSVTKSTKYLSYDIYPENIRES